MNWRIAAIALACAGAFFLGGYWKGHHDADQSATVKRLTDERDSMSRTIDSYRNTNEKLNEIANNAKEKEERARTLASALRHDADSLRGQLQDIVDAYRPGSASRGAPASQVVRLLAGLLDEANRTSNELSEEAERYRRAGEQCELSYDAVRRSQTLTEKR